MADALHPALVEAAVDRWRGEHKRWKLRTNKRSRRYEAVRLNNDDEPEVMESYPFGKNNAEDAFNLARDKACVRAVLAAFAAGRAVGPEREREIVMIFYRGLSADHPRRYEANYMDDSSISGHGPTEAEAIADLKRKEGT